MIWVVGDIQGCALELQDLLDRVRFDASRDELWSLGDVVNCGPDSLAALRLWRDAGGRAVLGNHDVYAVLARTGRRPRKQDDTLGALFGAADADALLERLRSQPVLARLSGDGPVGQAWLVHAGLDPRWSDLDAVERRLGPGVHTDAWLESPEVTFATRVRCCSAAGERCGHKGPPATCPAPFGPWDEHYAGNTLVVHGHWGSRGYYRGTRRTIGLDSWCVYGGELTGWCLEEDRVEQVPSRLAGRAPRRIDLGSRAP